MLLRYHLPIRGELIKLDRAEVGLTMKVALAPPEHIEYVVVPLKREGRMVFVPEEVTSPTKRLNPGALN